MKSVAVEYYALLKDERGLDAETVRTDAATPRQLYQRLAVQRGFSLPCDRLKVAVNEDFAPWDRPLEDGDTVAFFPPVAGG